MNKNLVIASLCILLTASMIAVVVLYMQRHPTAAPRIQLNIQVQCLDDAAANMLSAQDKQRIDEALTNHSETVQSGKLLLQARRRNQPGADALTPVFQLVLQMHSGWTLESKRIPADPAALARAVANKIHYIARQYESLRQKYHDKAHSRFTVYDL